MASHCFYVRPKIPTKNKMLLRYTLEHVLSLEGSILFLIHVFILFAIFMRVKLDCAKISEGYKKHIIPILFIPIIFTFH